MGFSLGKHFPRNLGKLSVYRDVIFRDINMGSRQHTELGSNTEIVLI